MELKIIPYLIGLLLVAESTLASLYGNPYSKDQCQQILREARDLPIFPQRPTRLSGHFASSSCETRPGPEFVLRKYIFRRNSFYAQLFYYADEDCSEVTHYINARGKVKVLRPSWLTPWAYHSKYQLSQVSVTPYTQGKAKSFEVLMNRFCRHVGKLNLSPFRNFKIFKFPLGKKSKNSRDLEDYDCTKLFNFTMNELQLVRGLKRKVPVSSTGKVVRKKTRTELELYLGDISTNLKYRRQYRPTNFQAPLKRTKTPGCSVCRLVANSTKSRPPVLPKRHVVPVEIVGEWVTERCETRPDGQYLTRHITFLPGGESWEGIYEFFKDPKCSEEYFRLDVKGSYVKGERSDVIPSAHNYIFRTLRLKVTPLDYQMVSYLNSYDGKMCGKAKVWKIGVTQDVTRTKGCYSLGITLPNIEYEILKAEYDSRKSYLYVGQRPSSDASLSDEKNRPTSFQTPLVKCEKNELIKRKPRVVPDIAPVSEPLRLEKNAGTTVMSAALVFSSCLITLSTWSHLL